MINLWTVNKNSFSLRFTFFTFHFFTFTCCFISLEWYFIAKEVLLIEEVELLFVGIWRVLSIRRWRKLNNYGNTSWCNIERNLNFRVSLEHTLTFQFIVNFLYNFLIVIQGLTPWCLLFTERSHILKEVCLTFPSWQKDIYKMS